MMRLLGTLAVLSLFSPRNCCEQRCCEPHHCEQHRCEPHHCEPSHGHGNSCDFHGGRRGSWHNHNRRW